MKPGDYIEMNIGSDKNPKLIKIGKETSKKERNDLINLVKEYRDVFSVRFLSFKQYYLRILSERITCTTINTRDKKHKEFSLGNP